MLAYLQGEAGMVRVKRTLEDAKQGHAQLHMSIINLGEVLYIIERERGLVKAHEVLAAIQQLPIKIRPADNQTVFDAAHVKANHAVSYADAFAIECAQANGGTVLTGDKEFKAVETLVDVEWLQQD